jgi:hypothetical protein
MIESPSRAPRV